jgi:hypothetical protein
MQQPVLLEALFAICQARINVEATSETSQSVAVLEHRERALVLSKDSLKWSPDSFHDGFLLTILILMTVDAFHSNFSSFEANLKGALHIIAMKDGMKSLG